MPDADSKSLLPPGLRWAGPLVAPLYGLGVKIHRSISAKKFAPITTICIGNLTVGGTGKTPAVIYFARELANRGRKPAILMRGYKAQGGDEAEEAKAALKDLEIPIILGSDRLSSAIKAREMGCDVVLLDDGFQHWRLARDLDVVLIDATDPFGGDALVPAGRLREPVSGLARAGVVIVTRSNGMTDSMRAELTQRIRTLAPNALLCFAEHADSTLRALNATAASALNKGARVVGACGIGNPGAFKRTLSERGMDVIDFKAFDDHHAFTQHDLNALVELCHQKNAEALVVTEKDAVKIAKLKLPDSPDILSLGITFKVDNPGVLWEKIDHAIKAGDARAR